MRRFFLFLLSGALALTFTGRHQFHYYLTEQDFLSDRRVPRDQVHGRAHLVAEYDGQGRLITKVHVDAGGDTLGLERYTYDDTTGIIRIKKVYGPGNHLLTRTIFGPEELSHAFIEYVYGVDTVKAWGDRFTQSFYREDGQPFLHEFRDVDGFEYGNIGFMYDSTGHMSSQLWIKLPSKRIMRRWEYVFDPLTEVNRVMEYDSNGVLVSDLKLSADGTEAVFWFQSPADSEFINHYRCSYTLESNLDSGSLTWYWTGGQPDPVDSHRVELVGPRLIQGEHLDVEFELETPLVDGAIYRLVFRGQGSHGFPATERRIEALNYDISPPDLFLAVDSFIRVPEIAFTSNESLVSAMLIWEPDTGVTAGGLPVSVPLTEVDLAKSGQGMFRPAQQPELIDGMVYQAKLTGTDRAGNQSESMTVHGIHYDVTPPALAITAPVSGTPINMPVLSYTLSEDLVAATVVFENTRGKTDLYAPHRITLAAEQLLAGEHQADFSAQLALTDGAEYRILLSGVDRAGNVADTVSVVDLQYDITPPLLTLIFPASGIAIKDATVSYVSNEPLAAAEFRWEQTAGTSDSLAPHIVSLVGEELSTGEKIHWQLTNEPTLTDGAVYTITLVGQDLAGNESVPVVATAVLYDAIPPTITVDEPVAGTAVNHLHLSYSLSENLERGRIRWTRIGGAPDPLSPHTVDLTGAELEAGTHESITLTNMSFLQDGASYRIEFIGSDRAGNEAAPVVIDDIFYDITAPVITVYQPRPHQFLADKQVVYTLSEDLESGWMRWQVTGGPADSLAPHEINLSPEDRRAGEHTWIPATGELPIQEGTIYVFSFEGMDRAGNEAVVVTLPGLTYDFTPPVLSLKYPAANSAVNHKQVSYFLSENLAQASFIWTWVGGVTDPEAPHRQSLMGDELLQGDHEDLELVNAPPLVDGAVYSIQLEGEDFAGHFARTDLVDQVLYDVTAPQFAIQAPGPYQYVPSPAVTYSLSEAIAAGKITYTQTMGTRDPNSPHVIVLNSDQRQPGVHEREFEVDGPELVEGAIYLIRLDGRDRAGNSATPVTVQGVIFDASPPEVTLSYPETGSFINNILISYSTSELLESGELIWTRTGGPEDVQSPHRVPLVDYELAAGLHERIRVKNFPHLVDGCVYRVDFFGEDPAGNRSDTVSVYDVTYDVTAPVITITFPTDGIYSSDANVIFTLSEDLARGEITWHGTTPQGQPSEIAYSLEGATLRSGEHQLSDDYLPQLVDGGTYDITIEGEDFAGNRALAPKVVNFHFDRTPPVFTELYPPDSTFVNQDVVGYTLSEKIQSGTVQFIATGGREDPVQVYTIELTGKELEPGEHQPLRLTRQTTLQDGTEYRLQIFGVDLAGNLSDTLVHSGIVYDITPPELEIISPTGDGFIRTTDLVLRVSEPLQSGEIVWETANGRSQTYSLEPQFRSAGQHTITGYPVTLTEQANYTLRFTGTDRAGNQGEATAVANLYFDQTPPEITVRAPQPGTVVNHTRISYTVSEPLLTGSIRWELVSRTDPAAPHLAELFGDELSAGDHEELMLANSPTLVDSAVYRIVFQGTDRAGNVAEPQIIEPVEYDVSPPLFTDLSPENDQAVNKVQLAYKLTEDLVDGTITFTRIAGATDDQSPHVVKLAGSRLKQGPGGGELPKALLHLVNGTVYDVEFWGKDRAGNESPPTRIRNLRFDDEAPSIQITQPVSDAYITTLVWSYTLSEDLAEAEAVFEQVGGVPDPQSPRIVSLTSDERSAGEHTGVIWQNLAELVDGAVYTLVIRGRDPAGNEGRSEVVERVAYDISKPVITVHFPATDLEINTVTVSYSLSEDLAEGGIKITPVGGSPEDRPPQTILWVNDELSAGRKDSLSLTNQLTLINGVRYDLEFFGTDRAGNEADPVMIRNVEYDNEPPVVTISLPIDGEQIKQTQVSYLLSEDLAWGTVIFTRTGGTTDPQSPHRVPLRGDALNQGVHNEVDLSLEDQLADGARYSVQIDGADRAGNKVAGVTIRNILFDVLPPQLQVLYPHADAYLNTAVIGFSTNEGLSLATVTFTRIGGADDPGSPHVVELGKPHLGEGEHADIVLPQVELQDGSTYSVALAATDLAGNEATPVTVSPVHYDVSPPVLSVLEPEGGSYLQELILTFETNEALQSGIIKMVRREGVLDPASPHEFEFPVELLSQGRHPGVNLSQQLSLTSGTRYTLSMSATDRAGNVSQEIVIDDLMIDTDPPRLTLSAPTEASLVNHTRFSIEVGEDLQALHIQWIWRGGTSDPAGTHRVTLPPSLLVAGSYRDIEPPDPPELVSGGTYAMILEGTDLAGNAAADSVTGIIYDIDPPQVTWMYPANDSYLNAPRVGYRLSEPLQEGELVWTATGGMADPGSPHRIALSGAELTSGVLDTGRVTNQDELRDGTVYQLTMRLVDRAGNETTTTLADNVTFDVTPPVISKILPAAGSFVNSTVVQFALSEPVRSGEITWTRTGGTPDPGAPHRLALPDELRTPGDHTTAALPPFELVSGAHYTLTLSAVDRAGNRSREYALTDITYDVDSPALAILSPASGSYINRTEFKLRLSEPLQSGLLTFNRIGGTDDPAAPRRYDLAGNELVNTTPTGFGLQRPVQLQDGTLYRVEFTARDRAGNEATPAVLDSVFYDATPPRITITMPQPNRVAIGPKISYSLTENLVSGSATWVREGGLPDSQSPHVIELAAEERQAGEHRDFVLANQTELSVGAVYTLVLKGKDRAGNESLPGKISGIEMVRPLEGNWYFKGAIMTVAWTFEADPGTDGTVGTFAQGIQLGTKISNQEFGRYKLDYSRKPWVMEWELESGQKRISLFEFQDNNHLRVVTGTKKPKNWSDGEVMIYEFRP
jgi:CheY-specific phosphatase CheX